MSTSLCDGTFRQAQDEFVELPAEEQSDHVGRDIQDCMLDVLLMHRIIRRNSVHRATRQAYSPRYLSYMIRLFLCRKPANSSQA